MPAKSETLAPLTPESSALITEPKAHADAPTQQVQMTLEQLQAFVQTISSTQADVLAAALEKARKPYVSPEQEQNDAAMRKQMKAQANQAKLNDRAFMDACPHLQGCNPLSDSSSPTGASSIIHHKLDTNVIVGICTNCCRQFWPGDTDYMKEMGRKSGNRPSASGYRFFFDPGAAAAAR